MAVSAETDIDKLIAQLNSAGGGSGSTKKKTTSYLGMPKGYEPPNYFEPLRGRSRENLSDKAPAPYPGVQRPSNYTSGAEKELAGWSVERIARLQRQLVAVGLIGPKTKFRYKLADNVTIGAYKKLLEIANRNGTDAAGALDLLASNPAMSAEGMVDHTPSVTKDRTTDYADYTEQDAKALGVQAWTEANGRAPKGAELARLEKFLDAYASKNPTVTNTTQRDDGYGNTTTTRRSTGGVSQAGASQVALETAQAAPDYAEYQAAGTYFPALERMLGATANVQGL